MSQSELPLSQIKPPKHRLREEMGELGELKKSMKDNGLIEPILVRPVNGHYEVVVGHRRYLCAIELGWKEIPTIIREVDNQTAFEFALEENMHRQTMDVLEEAHAFNGYVNDYQYGGIAQLAEKIHKSEGYVINRLKLLHLPTEIRSEIKTKRITPSHAVALSSLNNDQATQLTEEIVKTGLSAEQTNTAASYVRAGLTPEQAVRRTIEFPDEAPPKEVKYDVTKLMRENIVLTLEKALKAIDAELRDLAEGEEKQWWIHEVRFPTHEVLNSAIKLRKELDKEK